MKINWINCGLAGLLALALAGCGGPSPDDALKGLAAGIVKHDKAAFLKYQYMDRKSLKELEANPEIADLMFDKLVDDDMVKICKVIMGSKLKVIGDSPMHRTIRVTPTDPKIVKELKDDGCRGLTFKAHNVNGEWKVDLGSITPIPISR